MTHHQNFEAFPEGFNPKDSAFKSPVIKPMVQIEQPQQTLISDATGHSLALPSKFQFYKFKDLFTTDIKGKHLAKLAKAHQEGSMQVLAEVVSSLLYTSTGDKNIAFDLLLQDFQFVLYWLRLNNFGKPTMQINSICNNPDHLDRIKSGELSEESRNILTLYKDSDIKTVELDEIPNPEIYKVNFQGQDIGLRPETVRDGIQFLDSPKWTDSEYQYSARMASLLNLPALSLDQKIEIVGDLSPNEHSLIKQYGDLVGQFGVVESVNTKCIGCNASGVTTVAVDAASFLSDF